MFQQDLIYFQSLIHLLVGNLGLHERIGYPLSKSKNITVIKFAQVQREVIKVL
jgi:hypothetical protein